MDDGVTKAIETEFEDYNNRRGPRYPLSPSGMGNCALKLARDLAHYHGIANYPRSSVSRSPKLQRVFDRGNLLEDALIADFAKYTKLDMKLKQQRVHLFDVEANLSQMGPIKQPIEGDIDGMVLCRERGVRILVDFKSKGAYYSAGFNDSISEFFMKLVQTGLVKDLGHSCYMVTDVKALFDTLPLDDFFVNYLLQLNSYAFSDWFRRTPVDGVCLYYENKNTCQNYEVRWVPDERLFQYAKDKFQFIYERVMSTGPETVPREFLVGSTRCKLCEYNTLCNGENRPKQSGKITGRLEDSNLEVNFRLAVAGQKKLEKLEGEILLHMEKNDLTHIQLSDGMTYEKKFLKSPKPHFELRLSK